MNKNGVPHIIDHIPRNTRQRRPGFKLDWQFITIHSTGNPRSTARNERAWLTNPANTGPFVGWHIAVDENEAVEAIPLDEVAWHAGDGARGPGNRTTMAVEICESGDRVKTLDNAAKLVAALLEEKKKNVNDLRQHFDWNGKNCPFILREADGQGWREFVASVDSFLKKEEPDPLQDAIDLLARQGVIRSPEYWRANAVAGRLVQGEFVASLILRMAERLRM